jgi:hypothetical protein
MCTRAQEEGRSECNERDSEVVLGREGEGEKGWRIKTVWWKRSRS